MTAVVAVLSLTLAVVGLGGVLTTGGASAAGAWSHRVIKVTKTVTRTVTATATVTAPSEVRATATATVPGPTQTVTVTSSPTGTPAPPNAAPSASATNPGNDDAWVAGWGDPTWRDEFSGTTLDTTKWSAKSGYIGTDSDGYMTPDNVFLDGKGDLVLRSSKRANPITVSDGSTRGWDTGYVTSAGKFSARYGRWEVRYLSLKPMVSRGMWFGPWLRDDSGGGEADLSESVGSPGGHPEYYPNDGSASSSTLYTQTGAGTVGVDRTANTMWKYAQVPANQQTDGAYYGWHVAVLEFTPNRMTIYNDGAKVLEVTTATALGQSIINKGFPSTQHMRISQHVGSDWLGHPDSRTLTPYDSKIDYVRYWPYNGQS